MVKLNKKLIKDYMNNTSSNATDETYSCDYINDCNTYSTSETLTGKTWIDGKPIYRKVVTFTCPINTTIYSYQLNISNVNDVTSLQVLHRRNTDIEGIYYNTSSDFFRAFYRGNVPNTLEIRCSALAVDENVKVILEYTKTTD